MSDISIFICDFGRDKPLCQTCGGLAPMSCTFELRGRLEGKKCDRRVCSKCAKGTGLCPPHQRVRHA